ncbi:uncharacterized protein LOC106388836 [Brassica napus]|uniref:(rape) hypothetical protein n=1 Tax=Brassica napus TaxID=3708 RepID=A0A816I4S3_BRANA|nr:uncharacterized protein LOC106388836 [Brassica napus]XP_013684452.1 uncharacterized protein LOC106388836 [Brassica napus]XP_013684453.1 uncharacterized protein LOC106388836 [Brassica napus]XP_013684454.1 uncharacterized protein LOC106388836 [Brassica napus]CAF1703533.1 unnamed protein product [Brassica napus]
MNINRDEALRAKDLAEGLMKKSDFTGARKLALKANKMDPSLENITHMTMVCDVHCAATEKLFANELDWYGILQVELNADDIVIKKQYRRLALLLHPDKNKLPGAESAFKLIGEAQRILLDREKRTVYDTKRRAWRKPAPAPSYKVQQVPRNHRAQQASVNLRNVYNDLRTHPQQRAPQGPPAAAAAAAAAFSHRPTFWTSCPFCRTRYEYSRESIMKQTSCLACKKQFTALEIPFQNVVPPAATNSCQNTYAFPQQNKAPAQKAPPTVPSGKATTNRKRKKKNVDESSESSDSESDSESEDNAFGDTMAAQGLGSNGGQQPRRSVRSKRQVSYKENLKDDDVDLVNEDGEGSGKNIDTEKEEEQTLEDHHSTETLPNGVNPKEKIKEDQVKVESEDSASDSEDDLCSGSEAKPNVINCDDPEFSDFDKLRAKGCFQPGQIWALYDDGEGMPRFYGLITTARTTPVFSVTYKWLESEEDEEARNLPVSVGKYRLGGDEKTDNTNVFSHFVQMRIGRARRLKVFPKKGETWALFKNWNKGVPSDSDSSHEYEFVEILSDHAEESAISVGFLSKVEGFKFVFCPVAKDGSETCEIPPHEFCRFSHGVPSNRLKGTEGRGVLEGWYELDPAALLVPGSQNIPGEEAAGQEQDHQSPPLGSAC